MKSILFTCAFFMAYTAMHAQETGNTGVAVKGYLSFKGDDNPGNYSDGYFQIGSPTFAFSILKPKGNYHQIELSDIAFKMDQLYSGSNLNFDLGFRYTYNISVLKSKNGKFRTFIAPGFHSLISYQSGISETTPEFKYNSTTITGELEAVPTLAYALSSHFSVEATVPVTLIGFSEDFYNSFSPGHYGYAYLGPQYFLGKAGVAFNW